SDDDDPVDVLVWTPYPMQPGSMIRCRPVAMLAMSDEKGQDAKILAVPADKISNNLYADAIDLDDVTAYLKHQIAHFFEHYKDLEDGKWVRIDEWRSAAAAREEIVASIKRAEMG